jgi:hypothetical protein
MGCDGNLVIQTVTHPFNYFYFKDTQRLCPFSICSDADDVYSWGTLFDSGLLWLTWLSIPWFYSVPQVNAGVVPLNCHSPLAFPIQPYIIHISTLNTLCSWYGLPNHFHAQIISRWLFLCFTFWYFFPLIMPHTKHTVKKDWFLASYLFRGCKVHVPSGNRRLNI